MIRPEHAGQRAFTFLESLVVMLLIILLASIVIPGLLGKKKKVVKSPTVMPVAEAVESSKSALDQANGTSTAGAEASVADPKPAGAAR